MRARPILEECYTKDKDVINFVIYKSTTGSGYDEVLQHKILGITETAHVTLHSNGKINFRIKRSKVYLKNAIVNTMNGYKPKISEKVKKIINRVRKPLI